MTQPIELMPTEPAATGRLLALPDHGTRVRDHLTAVDGLLDRTMAALSEQWAELVGGRPADVLGSADLPQLLTTLLRSGGKRIRPTMTCLG